MDECIMYVCMSECVYVRTYDVYIRLYVFTYVRMCVCMYVCSMYKYMHAYYIHTYMQCKCMYCVSIYIYIYIYIYAFACVYAELNLHTVKTNDKTPVVPVY